MTKRQQTLTVVRVHKRRSGAVLKDQRGAVAFETLIVYVFMVTSLLLPLADVATAGFQFIRGWAALRSFGQYLQYKTPADPTSTATWKSALQTSVAGYTINNIVVSCGDGTPPTACSNATLSPKFYSFTTTVTVAPILLTSVLCVSGGPNPCSYTLAYSERFQ